MAFSLRNLRVNRVALVDKGANFDAASGDGAHVMLFKRVEKANNPSDVHVDVPHPNKKETDVEKSLFDKFKAFLKTDNTMTDAEKKAAQDAMDAETAKAATQKAAEDVVAKAAIEKAEADKSAVVKAAEAIAKMEALEKRVTDAEAIAKAERDLRLNGEQIAVLKSLKCVSVDVEKDAAILRKLHESDTPAYDRVIALLKGADALVEKSAMFQAFGSSMNSNGGDAWSQIEAKAATLVEKSTSGLTKEQAIEKVMLDNPTLVKEYRAQQQ